MTGTAVNRHAAPIDAAASPAEWQAIRPFVLMLACSGLICVGLFVGKLLDHKPALQYIQFLVTYEFGVIKRALIGDLLSYIRPRVGYADVFAFGLVAWLTTLAVYLLVFRRIFTFTVRTIPLLALVLGSPFFFKNFMSTIGYFDVLGCLAALIALLLPVNIAYVLVMGAISCALLFVHHLHFLLYVPTIAFIVIARALAADRLSPAFLGAGAVATLALGGVFYGLAFHGSLTVPTDVFIAALRGRAIDDTSIIMPYIRIYYTGIDTELALTGPQLPNRAVRIPVYAALIFIHLPLIGYFRRMILALAQRHLRVLVVTGLIGITLGYVIILVVVSDTARWVANWGACMILAMHAVRLLPSSDREAVPIDPAEPRNHWFGWILACVPRTGIINPF